MKTENSNSISAPLRIALLAISLSGAAMIAGCNKPVEETPVPTDTAPPPAETPPPTDTPPPTVPPDQNPDMPPADEPPTTPAPTDSDAPPSGG